MRRLALLATCLLAAAPATAQQVTLEQAARANLTIAATFCMSPAPNPNTTVSWFRQAGFTERAEISGGDSTFYFRAPADTVIAEFYFGHLPEECRARTNHLGVTGASELLDAIVPQIHPSYVRKLVQGPVDPATGRPAVCVHYEDPANDIGHVVGVAAADVVGDQRCIENGTSLIYSSSRV
jgi:hypothetical protein